MDWASGEEKSQEEVSSTGSTYVGLLSYQEDVAEWIGPVPAAAVTEAAAGWEPAVKKSPLMTTSNSVQ
jgi:hypothetical protein